MTADQTPRIQYALESLPELLSAHDLQLIGKAIGLHPYAMHRDNIRHYVEKAVSNHEKRKAAEEQEHREKQQRAYEEKLTPDDEGFYNWEGYMLPNGPTANMFPALRDTPEGIPIAKPLVIEVEFSNGRRATIEYIDINWSRVKRWKVVE